MGVARLNSRPQGSVPRNFSPADLTLPTHSESAEQKISISPQWHHTTFGHREGHTSMMDRQWLRREQQFCILPVACNGMIGYIADKEDLCRFHWCYSPEAWTEMRCAPGTRLPTW